SEAYNLVERMGAERMLSAEFLATVDRDEPVRLIAEAMAADGAQSYVNRMLARDLRFTLADDDLIKVRGACALAGVDCAFPMLDDDLLRFSLRLPPSWKLRRTRLRPFFKEALRDFLPQAVLTKEKHGFGLPFGVWLAQDRRLRELAGDSLMGLKSRDILRTDFLDALLDRWLPEHPAYYGTLVWVLMMLEQWFESRGAVDAQWDVARA
ncbi:MAG: asparagine synthase C-terminal domain-containing protein, partial [Nitrococcus sp.]|nr:asparagine synthase C-terminal domain-containing protein [Nitrococcus sp.]